MKTRILKLGTTIAIMLPYLAACGGGGGYGDGTNPPPPPPTGGITRTGDAVAVGPITGIGSVIVNGVRYNTDTATFTRDDNPSPGLDDFRVGETVIVKGTISDDNVNGVALEVEFEEAVEGPVDDTSVNETAGTFEVLGQTVRVVPTTSFDDNCSGGLAGLVNYPQVEVSGSADDQGVIEATRVECKSVVGANDLWEVNGRVTNLTATTFQINTLVVNYNGADMRDFPNRAIAEDDPVEVKTARPLAANGEFLADVVEYKGARFAGDDDVGDHMEIEGFITSFQSPTNFEVSGIRVKEITGTRYEGGSRTDLGLGLKVEVEGEFDTEGVLNATKIEIKASTAIRVVGALDLKDGNTLQVLGITINTDPAKTRFEDKTAAEANPLLAALTPGNYLEVRGQELPEGQITAVIVERDDPRERIELRGFVEVGGLDTVDRTLTVLGVLITSGQVEVYRDANDVAISADAFWAAVKEGSLVDAREDLAKDVFPQPGVTTIDATELQLELE